MHTVVLSRIQCCEITGKFKLNSDHDLKIYRYHFLRLVIIFLFLLINFIQ